MANEKMIWNKLVGVFGLSVAGAAALMGNLYAESALIPTNLQNSYERKLGYDDARYTAAVDNGSYTQFVYDKAGYGLAQWTYHTRKAALYDFAKAQGKSIGDLDMQLDFLYKELKESYPKVLSALMTATDVRAASDVVMVQFENPADQSETAKAKRASFGQKYFEQFGSTSEPVTPPCPASEAMIGTLTLGGKMYAVTLTEV